MSNDISTDVHYIYTIKFVFFCFSKSGFRKETMNGWLMLVCFYFL